VIDLAHRAVTSAALAGLLGRSLRGLRVRAGGLGALAAAPGDADLYVAVDDGASAVPTVRAPLALVIASPVAASLVALALAADDVAVAPNAIEGYAAAREWARARAAHAPTRTRPDDGAQGGVAIAPPVTPERLLAIAEIAAASGLVLVEPDLPAPLARLRTTFPRPLDRAVAATIALGHTARPVLFVPEASAPKAQPLRVKPERLGDGWIRASAAAPPDEEALVAAALETLAERAAPVAFKELLREARERWSSAARRGGSRASPSAGDAAKLATALERLSHQGVVELFAVDPAAPDWDLSVA
jgi:hypothetical protein